MRTLHHPATRELNLQMGFSKVKAWAAPEAGNVM